MSTKELHVVCNKCGKEAPIDQERSTVLGVAYDTSRPCKCGGEWEVQEKVNEIINKDNDKQVTLENLECAGVDNWEGYGFAFDREQNPGMKKDEFYEDYEDRIITDIILKEYKEIK